MNVVDRASRLVDGFGASRAQMPGVKESTAEGAECLVEARAAIVDEIPVRVLAHEEAFELE